MYFFFFVFFFKPGLFLKNSLLWVFVLKNIYITFYLKSYYIKVNYDNVIISQEVCVENDWGTKKFFFFLTKAHKLFYVFTLDEGYH